MPYYVPNLRNRRTGLDAIQVGLFGQTVGVSMIFFTQRLRAAPGVGWAGEILAILGTSVLVSGCARFAHFRRRNRWWGILGLLNFVGVLILLLIPRRKSVTGFDLSPNEPRRDVWRMEVHVSLPGLDHPILLHLPRGATVEAAARMLTGVLPNFEEKLKAARFLINGHPAQRTDELSDQNKLEIATSPPGRRIEYLGAAGGYRP
jgi:putative ubiquitin-RnfH superfamily antitoxin RatB of RatAB toxin-antitoxin module